MSRILLAWELGGNLGHLSRLLPLATRLKRNGHSILAVVQDVVSAAPMLGPAEIPYVPCPRHTGVRQPIEHPASYADLLLAQGWGDSAALWGLIQGWVNLYRMFEPDVAVLDYAPSARLAARVMRTPCVLVGSGFVIPPATDPLPPFPSLPWATNNRANESERAVLERVNAAMKAFRAPRLEALRVLFDADRVVLTTFPELDPYGVRDDSWYVGPLGNPGIGEIVDWPSGATGPRVIAYLRPEVRDVTILLEGLAGSGAALVCYAPGLPKETVSRFANAHRIFAPRPVQHERLFAAADACLSYAPAGTVTHSLLSGVPQVLAPLHIETRLTAQRVEALGAGVVLYGSQTPSSVAFVVNRLSTDSHYRARARAFADRYQDHDPEQAADKIVGCIEDVARKNLTTRQHGGRGVSDGVAT